MTDELDRLKSALAENTPVADEASKEAALIAAQKKFADLQGSADPARPIPEASQNAEPFWKGIYTMLSNLNMRPVLYATTCLAFAGVAFVSYQSGQLSDGGKTGTYDSIAVEEELYEASETADMAAEADAVASEAQPAPLVETNESRARLAAKQAPAATLGGILPDQDAGHINTENNDRFLETEQNPVKITADEPVSTFSIDVDTSSYAYVRNAILAGRFPSEDAVRIEEMINYFPYDYPAPETAEHPFETSVSVMQTPWNEDTQLVHIGIQGEKPVVENRPPLNLVFLIDTSGSMQDPNKLPLLKQSFRLLLSQLNANDQVAIVTYAGSAGMVLEPTSASDSATILESLNNLEAGGSTAGQEGLQQAYALAEKMGQDGDIGRVLLATDGDFNVGISDPDDLQDYVERRRDSGIYLSVFGFGQGNYRDDIMQTLAQNGNGTAAYIDTLAEAQKVMVDQVSGALYPIANDVKIQVEFNPEVVAEYRLIGYETRMLDREDFNNDKVDAGEIGAGHTVTAIYEITPVGSPAVLNDPLRYGSDGEAETSGSREIGFLKLRYKNPGSSESTLISTPITDKDGQANSEASFAAAIAGFGQLLKGGKYTGDWSYDDAMALASGAKGEDRFGYRAEAVRLMQLAKSIR